MPRIFCEPSPHPADGISTIRWVPADSDLRAAARRPAGVELSGSEGGQAGGIGGIAG